MSKRSPKTKSKRRSRALPALGFAGVSLSMASGACASIGEATANTSPTSQSHSQQIFLGEEEISDVSLATFYVFDKESAGPSQLKLARGCGGGGCGGHGCGHGHFFFGRCIGCGGCGGCGGTCWIWTPAWGWVYSCGAQSAPASDEPPVASESKIEQTPETVETVEGSLGGARTK